MSIIVNGFRLFSFGELYGPFPCEKKVSEGKCQKDAWTAVLTKEEDKTLPQESGPEACQYILQNRVGTMLCGKHCDEKLGQITENSFEDNN